jgi:hypothetical protein
MLFVTNARLPMAVSGYPSDKIASALDEMQVS